MKSRLYKRIFFDIETSPAIGVFWRTGKQVITHQQILEPYKIICICWQLEGEDIVHELHWDTKQDDKSMLRKFAKIVEDSDELIAHNSDNFDVKVFRTRCMLNDVMITPYITTTDTLKLARRFKFMSNRLDAIDKEFGNDGKMSHSGIQLWIDTKVNKSKEALQTMIEYCKEDVRVLVRVYNKLVPYCKPNVHVGVVTKDDRLTCPHCAGDKFHISKTVVSAMGIKKRQMKCTNDVCGRYFTLTDALYQKIISSEN